MSFENWTFWWAYNKDEILNLKAAVKKMEQTTSTKTSPHFFGTGSEKNRSETQAPTEAMIQNDIVPALLKVIEDTEMHADIRGGAIIALSRCGGGKAHVQTFFKYAKVGSGEDRLVQESAIVALGILQIRDEEIRDFLLKIVDDTEENFRPRCFAALSLGLLNCSDPVVYESLERCLTGRESTPDMPVVALYTMGLIGNAEKVPDLEKWLKESRYGKNTLSDLDRAYIVSALGKIGDPQCLKTVEATLRKKGSLARRSAMIAMGQLIPMVEAKQQVAYVEKLAALLKNESDTTAMNFGIMSLGRIGGRDDASDDVRKLCMKVLADQYKNGGKATERPFAALALGLVGFEGSKTGSKPKELRYAISEMLKADLQKLRGDKVALGANAIALGMLGDTGKETVSLLTKILQDRGLDKKLRGAAATALGLISDGSAREAILSALGEREDRELRKDTAIAAGLLRDSKAVDMLVKVLSDPKASQFVLGSVALAIGQIGDSTAIGPLIKILEPERTNGSYPDLTRALVAVALGQIADRRDIRVLSRLSKDVNYRASVNAMDEVLTIL
jgi:HEAT repeat protein